MQHLEVDAFLAGLALLGSFAGELHGVDSDLDVLVETSALMGLSFLSRVHDASGRVGDAIAARPAWGVQRGTGRKRAKRGEYSRQLGGYDL